jgi:hypothetical protein
LSRGSSPCGRPPEPLVGYRIKPSPHWSNVGLIVIGSAIAIIHRTVIDPVGAGFVASLAHPGGNITGFATPENTIGGKWLELLKDDTADPR